MPLSLARHAAQCAATRGWLAAPDCRAQTRAGRRTPASPAPGRPSGQGRTLQECGPKPSRRRPTSSCRARARCRLVRRPVGAAATPEAMTAVTPAAPPAAAHRASRIAAQHRKLIWPNCTVNMRRAFLHRVRCLRGRHHRVQLEQSRRCGRARARQLTTLRVDVGRLNRREHRWPRNSSNSKQPSPGSKRNAPCSAMQWSIWRRARCAPGWPRVSCVVRDCTINRGWASNLEIRSADIFAPRRLKKNKIRLVKKIERIVRPIKRVIALIPRIIAWV